MNATLTKEQERRKRLLSFSLYRFAQQAHAIASEAAQDKECRVWADPIAAMRAFMNDAKDAESLYEQIGSGDLVSVPADLVNVGSQMANVMFNWSQDDKRFTDQERKMMDDLRKRWDAQGSKT